MAAALAVRVSGNPKNQGDIAMKRINLLTDDRGATSIEYAAIASLVSIVAIAAFMTLGAKVDTMFGGILSAM